MPEPIDQERRLELCRRILAGDRTAAQELAELYRAAGYYTTAAVIAQAASADERAWQSLERHARTLLGLPVDP